MELATLHKLVEAIYTDKRLRQLLGKLQPADLRDDLLHHVIERIYKFNEQHPERIGELASKDKVFCIYVGANEQREQQLFAWLVGNMKMELFSPRSPFSRKYRKVFEELPKWAMGIGEYDHEERGPSGLEDKFKVDKFYAMAKDNEAADKLIQQAEEREKLRLLGLKEKKYNPLQFELFGFDLQ